MHVCAVPTRRPNGRDIVAPQRVTVELIVAAELADPVAVSSDHPRRPLRKRRGLPCRRRHRLAPGRGLLVVRRPHLLDHRLPGRHRLVVRVDEVVAHGLARAHVLDHGHVDAGDGAGGGHVVVAVGLVDDDAARADVPLCGRRVGDLRLRGRYPLLLLMAGVVDREGALALLHPARAVVVEEVASGESDGSPIEFVVIARAPSRGNSWSSVLVLRAVRGRPPVGPVRVGIHHSTWLLSSTYALGFWPGSCGLMLMLMLLDLGVVVEVATAGHGAETYQGGGRRSMLSTTSSF